MTLNLQVEQETETYRILRDTSRACRLKLLHLNKCQMCGVAVQLAYGQTYSEAHHIKPRGTPHNGPDVDENILVLCPTHHVQCDYGAIKLNYTGLHAASQRPIAQEYIDYHNTVIYKS